jgi:predicted alpha/beta superfamily hydrolase
MASSCSSSGDTRSPEQVASHESFTVESSVLGESRLVNIHLPADYEAIVAGGRRFPVLYMPDGGIDEDFPHVVASIEGLVKEGRIRPVIVVGIPNTQRRRDLTGPTTVASDLAIAPQVGGSELFRTFIREELIPEVDQRYATTPERTLLGESLAGLFVVETLVTDASLFDHYIAFDPSLWWNDGALLGSAQDALAGPHVRGVTLYLASSSEDRTPGAAQLAELIHSMELVWLSVNFESRPEFTHATIFRGLEKEALAEVLR